MKKAVERVELRGESRRKGVAGGRADRSEAGGEPRKRSAVFLFEARLDEGVGARPGGRNQTGGKGRSIWKGDERKGKEGEGRQTMKR